MWQRTVVAIGLVWIISGCTSARTPDPRKESGIGHVVVFWLKDAGNAEHRATILNASRRFEQIPGVVSVEAGQVIASTRPVVDSSFDVAVVIRFSDEQAMREYDQHPIHQEAVRGVLRELVERVRVYDFRYD
jgi:hypothetical protein